MDYEFIILPDAQKQIRELELSIARRIIKKLQWFARQENPLRFAVPLQNSSIGDIRFRIGDYRAVALLDVKKKMIMIAVVGHRKEIYR